MILGYLKRAGGLSSRLELGETWHWVLLRTCHHPLVLHQTCGRCKAPGLQTQVSCHCVYPIMSSNSVCDQALQYALPASGMYCIQIDYKCQLQCALVAVAQVMKLRVIRCVFGLREASSSSIL